MTSKTWISLYLTPKSKLACLMSLPPGYDRSLTLLFDYKIRESMLMTGNRIRY